ncbi:hypothetical protein [uncultured Sneathiella sp.]|uniref:hypothetical protein n=1 Tax=uncultured Sneathiella sp. TaxID=879315 RepID=UPI0030DC73C6
MWSTERNRKVELDERPVRVAYLVPIDVDHLLLDVLFDEAMSRWGGRRTPIIRTDGSIIDRDDWGFLELWDADIIYSYVPINEYLRDRVAYLLCPSSIKIHETADDVPTYHSLRPELTANYNYLLSMSVLPTFSKRATMRDISLPEILDRERWAIVPRDIEDSFGFVSNYLSDFSLLPFARRLNFSPKTEKKYAPRYRGENEIRSFETIEEMEAEIKDRRELATMSQLSDMFCPYLRAFDAGHESWNEHLTIVIGDTIDDRLLFWNAIHRYSSLDDLAHYQVLRFSLKRFTNGVPDFISHLCSGVRNHRRRAGNGAAYTIVRSCSIDDKVLQDIADKLKGTMNMVSHKHHDSSVIYSPLPLKPRNQGRGMYDAFWSPWSRTSGRTNKSFRYEGSEIDLPMYAPWFLSEAQTTRVTSGVWVADLKIERREDHCCYDNISHFWSFPKRLALHQAVGLENYGGGALVPGPELRPTATGKLSIWEGTSWYRPTLRLPNDYQAFTTALLYNHPNSYAMTEQNRNLRVKDLFLSDKGRDLLGVLQPFRNLPEALSFLTNFLFLSVIESLKEASLGVTPKRVKKLVHLLTAENAGKDAEEINYGAIVGRVLGKVISWHGKEEAQGKKLNYAELKRKLLPDDHNDNDGRAEVDECIRYLRNIDILRQGYAWRCKLCFHHNWTPNSEFTNELHCNICKTPENAPIGGDENVHFTLNPHITRAFSSSSGTGPVLWCINELANQARKSFILAPTLQIDISNGWSTDIDVLASVDGKVNMFEVKSSFSGVTEKEIEQLINLAKRFRPDIAGFAIKQPEENNTITQANISLLKGKLAELDVEFILMTFKNPESQDIPCRLGRKMKWRAW